jgi:hypothetical protein
MTLTKLLVFVAFVLALIAAALVIFHSDWAYSAALVPGALACFFLSLLVAPH